ncbi:hypothetical protein J7E82_16405 [Arthrobacter sp. ISL-30]|nr:hypothetical protein [Arthrobacter sp. ISL-30]
MAPPNRLAAVVLATLCCGSLSACEYTYEDTRAPLPAATSYTNPSLPRDPLRNNPVTGDDIEAWAEEVLPSLRGQAYHTKSGLLAPGESQSDQTAQLPVGTYAITLACRSRRQVGFVVQNGDVALVDLMVQCGTTKVNVVHVQSDSVLTVTATASRAANYAFRVSRI